MLGNKRPAWESSYWAKKHNSSLRCPFCGSEMDFHMFFGYEIHQSDWYWSCPKCHLSLSNEDHFKMDEVRKRWRQELYDRMMECRVKYKEVKNLYNQYGRYFTPKEKAKYLLETIEEHMPVSEEVE